MIRKRTPKSLFALGKLVATPGVLDLLQKNKHTPLEFYIRHQVGDWSGLCQEDKEANLAAVLNGGRVFSTYQLRDGTKVWVITEADHSVTTILLPSEY